MNKSYVILFRMETLIMEDKACLCISDILYLQTVNPLLQYCHTDSMTGGSRLQFLCETQSLHLPALMDYTAICKNNNRADLCECAG